MSDHSFVHLHVHTEYSFLDGANRCSALAAAAAEMGMPAIAITDHGVMYGCVEFYNACRAAGVKPILGCELYVAPSGHTRRDTKEQYHLIALAENDTGWHNLMRMVSIASTEGFYYKPRVDHDLIARYSEGIIFSSACLGGEIPALIMEGDLDGAAARARFYRDITGPENFFLELQSNSIPEQKRVNAALIEMARRDGYRLIATNDAHYLRREDASWHDILLCIGTKSTVTDPDRMRFVGDDYYLRSPEEMWAIFGDEVPESLTSTVEIAERCAVELPLSSGYHLPVFDIPEGETLATHLRQMAYRGLGERLGGEIPPEYRERMEYELGVIEKMDFPGYFCIVSDIIAAAKRMGIPVGPGRGSAAGSLVAWSCYITELDPIKHALLFERFLNPERVSMPDIDTDISDKQRDEVIAYIIDKYGADHVSQIITFGRMMSKQAVKDVGRAMGIPYADVERVARLLPDPLKSGIKTVKAALEQVPELREACEADPRAREMLDTACRVEGLARQAGKHAAGIVITPVPISEMVPVTRVKDSESVTQFPMEPVEKLGLVKMDFLGLTTLSIIQGALHNIEASRGERVDLSKIPYDDAAVFEMLRTAETLGVFQLESSGMRSLMRRLRPDRFEDLVALMALFRPGPLESGMADQYVRRKHGEERVEYPHPLLAEALEETYGVILYQEQVMQCASRLAGYTLGDADLLRRAMGKKKADVMAEQRAKFVSGAEARGVAAEKAGEIFDIIEKFAGYGFNKSHSAAYAMISYQTAWLKTHYPAEFLAAHLSAMTAGKLEHLAACITQIRSLGIDVKGPDINLSGADFTVSGGSILFGLSAVAKAGAAAVDAIIGSREEHGPFRSLWDMVSRPELRSINRGTAENLIKAGAFARLEPNRRRMLEALPQMLEMAGRRSSGAAGQRSIFGDAEMEEETPALPEVDDYPTRTLLDLEHEAIGIYISGHPYDEYAGEASRCATCALGDLERWRGESVPATVVCLLADSRERYTKRGEAMGILTVEDSRHRVEAVCFPRQWQEVKPTLREGAPYVIRGTVRRDGGLSLAVEDMRPLGEETSSAGGALRIKISTEGAPAEMYKELRAALSRHPGEQETLIELSGRGGRTTCMVRNMRTRASESLKQEIERITRGRARVV